MKVNTTAFVHSGNHIEKFTELRLTNKKEDGYYLVLTFYTIRDASSNLCTRARVYKRKGNISDHLFGTDFYKMCSSITFTKRLTQNILQKHHEQSLLDVDNIVISVIDHYQIKTEELYDKSFITT